MHNIHLPVIIEQDEDNVFIVSCPVFKGCRSYGKAIDDAVANIKEAIQICLDEQKDESAVNKFVGNRDIEVSYASSGT